MPYPTEFRNATLMKMRHLSVDILMNMLGRLDLLGTRREVEVMRELTRRDQLHWVLDRVIAAEKLAEFNGLLDNVCDR